MGGMNLDTNLTLIMLNNIFIPSITSIIGHLDKQSIDD